MINIGTNGSVAILISLAAASGLSTLVGFVLAVRFSRSRKGIAVGIGFSVGIMVVISIFELLPAALDALAPMNALLSATGGAILVALFHWVIPHQHLVKEHGMLGARLAKTSYLVALGMILHDVPEGFALANVYLAEPSVGVMLAIAIALHNIPEGFAIGVPAAQLKNRRLLTEVAAASVLT